MHAATSAFPILGRRKIVFSVESVLLLTAGVLALVVIAFFLGRRAERVRSQVWGHELSARSVPGAGRPEPLPVIRVARPAD